MKVDNLWTPPPPFFKHFYGHIAFLLPDHCTSLQAYPGETSSIQRNSENRFRPSWAQPAVFSLQPTLRAWVEEMLKIQRQKDVHESYLSIKKFSHTNVCVQPLVPNKTQPTCYIGVTIATFSKGQWSATQEKGDVLHVSNTVFLSAATPNGADWMLCTPTCIHPGRCSDPLTYRHNCQFLLPPTHRHWGQNLNLLQNGSRVSRYRWWFVSFAPPLGDHCVPPDWCSLNSLLSQMHTRVHYCADSQAHLDRMEPYTPLLFFGPSFNI